MIKVIMERSRQTVVCVSCGTIFSYESEDIKEFVVNYNYNHYDRSYDVISHKVQCPVCCRLKEINTIWVPKGGMQFEDVTK